MESEHMSGNGINDYAYDMDLQLRRRLDKIPGFFKNAKRFVETISAQEMAMLDQSALQVTPDQYGDIYRAAEDCARKLGIAMPYVYIRDYMLGNSGPDYGMNAYTIGTDDHQQVIMITGALVRRSTFGELKTIIGHECGHIHNRHIVYTVLFNYLEGIASGSKLPGFLTLGARMALNAWSRAAEVTADRAGLICSERVEDALTVQAKLLSGGLESENGFSLESIEKQLNRQNTNLLRFSELAYDHPFSTRRIMAMKLFSESDLFARWHPDLVKPGQKLIRHEDVERQCREIMDIVRM